MAARAEFLERIRREVAKTPGLFGASPAPRPADPAAAAEAIRRELAERWPEALERWPSAGRKPSSASGRSSSAWPGCSIARRTWTRSRR